MSHSLDHATTSRKPRCRVVKSAGFSLVELVMAIIIFTLVIGAVAKSMAGGFALAESTKDRMAAMAACEDAIADVMGEDITIAFARFNGTPADDPVGVGPSPGNGFIVLGLEAVDGDADGLAGQILFPGNGITLREDVVDAELGMPRDLNGDGVIDGLDHSADYTVLPVRVRVQWQGAGSDQQLDLVTTIVGNQP